MIWLHRGMTRSRAAAKDHLEVGKALYYSKHWRVHLVLSVKPFGCMPSTQSDGVMAAVSARNPGLLFLPIETAAEGEIHALSRVQMALGDARRHARAEFKRVLETSGLTFNDLRTYIAQHRELRRPFYRWKSVQGVAGTAAKVAANVGAMIRDGYGC